MRLDALPARLRLGTVLFEVGGDVAVGDQATNSLVTHYRKVTDFFLLHDGQALEQARFGPTYSYGPGHHVMEDRGSRIAPLGNDPSQQVPFGKDANSAHVRNQDSANSEVVHHESRVKHRLVAIYVESARSLLVKNVLSRGHVVPYSLS